MLPNYENDDDVMNTPCWKCNEHDKLCGNCHLARVRSRMGDVHSFSAALPPRFVSFSWAGWEASDLKTIDKYLEQLEHEQQEKRLKKAKKKTSRP
jgi:hypothetical protein